MPGSVASGTPCIIRIENPTRCNSVSKFYFIFIWSSKCFGRHAANHQEPKTALAASGFAYVDGCWMCSCWTLSGRACSAWQSLSNSMQLAVHQPCIRSISDCSKMQWPTEFMARKILSSSSNIQYFECLIALERLLINISESKSPESRSQGLRRLRRKSAVARLLRLWVRILPRAWSSVCCECCVLSGRGLCYELITGPEDSYLVVRREWAGPGPLGAVAPNKKKIKCS